MRLIKEESGSILVLSAVMLTCILGFAALGVDVGYLLLQRRNAQTAADCAAMEGALEANWASSDGTTVKAAAQSAAARNGFTDGSNGVTVTVNDGPASGPHAGNTDYIEVIVQQNAPTFFMRVFGRNTVTVGARAVAGPGSNAGCLYTLGTSGTDLSMTGSGNLTLTNCTVYDDSSGSNALSMTGSGSATATSFNLVGNYTKTGSGSISPTPKTGSLAVGDPLAFLPAPTIPGSCSATQRFTGSSSSALTSGCYDGISMTGSGSLSLGPGLYIINGNLSLTGSGGVTGTDVTLYVTGSVNMTGSGSMNLTAPTSGTYNGILLFQSRSDANPLSFTGSGGSSVSGIIYAPDAAATYTGSGATNINTDFVVKSLTMTGSGGFNDYTSLNGESPLQSTTLVE